MRDLFSQWPLAVSYGMGVDSTAMLIGMYQREIVPDLILFADTGGEKDETYAYHRVMSEWLRGVGFPEITVVRYQPKDFKNWPPYRTLEENCLTNGTLPSLAFGFKSCSLKWKVAPQEAFLRSWKPAREAWSAGGKVRKAIGYDCGPKDLRRRNHIGSQDDPFYRYEYPLIEWEWDRERCEKEIQYAGLPVPPKSSCFFCPAMQPKEIDTLDNDHLRRIVQMEARAAPRLRNIVGLWRKSTKARPGSMTDYIEANKLLPKEQIEHIRNTTIKRIVGFQQGYAAAKTTGTVDQFELINRPLDYRSGNQFIPGKSA